MVKNGNQNIFMDKLTAIDKSLLQGTPTTVRELLIGLKSKVFSTSTKESVVTVCTKKGESEPLTLILKCQHCDSLHLESGYNEPQFEMGDVIYIDKSNQIGDYISYGELVSMIEDEINNKDFMDSPISIACSEDSKSHPMTMLIKCSEDCPVIHIISYVKQEIIMN